MKLPRSIPITSIRTCCVAHAIAIDLSIIKFNSSISPNRDPFPFSRPLSQHYTTNRAPLHSLPSNTDSAPAVARTPSAEEAPHTPSEAAEARTQAAARLFHTSPEQQQGQHTRRGTQAGRSSSSRAARGGGPYGCVRLGGGGRGFRRGKTKSDARGCCARGSSEGASAGANNVKLKKSGARGGGFVFFVVRGLRL
jgi:hypothetical protein